MTTTPQPKFLLCLLLGASALITACNKEIETNEPETNPKELRLNFPANSLAINDIDSVTVILSKPGSSSIEKKLARQNGYMAADAGDVPSGNWQMEWLVYAKSPVANDNYRRQYAINSSAAFPLTASLQKTAPKGDFDGTWLPRVLMKDRASGLTFVIAMDFTDPYLSMKAAPGRKYVYYYIDRVASRAEGNNSTMVGADAIEVTGHFPSPYVVDKSSFTDLAETMKTRSWNKGEILVIVEEENGSENTFYYNYRK